MFVEFVNWLKWHKGRDYSLNDCLTFWEDKIAIMPLRIKFIALIYDQKDQKWFFFLLDRRSILDLQMKRAEFVKDYLSQVGKKIFKRDLNRFSDFSHYTRFRRHTFEIFFGTLDFSLRIFEWETFFFSFDLDFLTFKSKFQGDIFINEEKIVFGKKKVPKSRICNF